MLLLVVLLGIRNVVARIIIPVGFDHTGTAYVNATIPDVAGERIVQVTLTPQYHAGADLSIEDAGSTTLSLTNVSVHLPNEVTSMYRRFFFAIARGQSPYGYSGIHLGIGCGSPLVNDYGSVDYIKESSGVFIWYSIQQWTGFRMKLVQRIPCFHFP